MSPLDQKSFQELVFKAFKNRKRSGCVDRQQVRSIKRNLFFFKLKLLIKVPHEFIFRSVSLVCFTAELDEYIDWQSMYM